MSALTDTDRSWMRRERWMTGIGLSLIGLVALGLWIAAECRSMKGSLLPFIYGLLAGWWHEECGTIGEDWKVIYILWTLAVPALFFVHYDLQGKRWPPDSNKLLEHMRHHQQLGLSFWVAIAAIFAVVYLQ